MARVLVATRPWGTLWEKDGPASNGQGFRLKIPQTGVAASINTTVYTAATGPGTVASFVTNDDGELPGWVEEGSYTLTVGAESFPVEAVSGTLGARTSALEGSQTTQDTKIAVIQEAPLNVKDSRFGAVGDGVADDTAAITAVRAISAPYGRELFYPPGRYKDTAQRTLQTGETWKGAGGILDASERGVTTIEATFNGEYLIVPNNCNNWAIENLSLKGLRTLAAQDLLACKQCGHGAVRRVGIINAGRDGVTLAASLNIHFDTVYHALAKRHNLNTSGQANAIQWSKCLFRVADMWGIRIGGGMNLTFIAPTIESNNNVAAQTTGGGILMDPNDADISAYINVVLVGAHFENHAGGRPVQSLAGPRGWSFAEYASTYNETTRCSFASTGNLQSDNLVTTLGPHAVLEAGINSVWINPRKDGGGAFSLQDNSGNTLILAGKLPTSSRAGLGIQDLELFRDAQGNLAMLTANRRLITNGGFGTANTQVASTLGTVARRMPIYDDTGALLGYIPIYGSIT